MNCQIARNRILGLEEPADLTDELAAHVDDCADCLAWHQKYVRVDRVLGSLSVPASDGLGMIAIVERIRATPVPPLAAKRATAKPQAAEKRQAAEKPMRLNLEDDLPKRKFRSVGHVAAKFWPAGLIAATLLVGTIAWLSLRSGRPPQQNNMPADPLLDNVVKLNVELAKTETAEQRVVVLSNIADSLNQEMRDIARADATGENMRDLETMYRNVVLNALVAQAKLVEKTQRVAVLNKVADNLAQSGQKAEQVAAESPQHSADRLRDAASTAREATARLRGLIKEAS